MLFESITGPQPPREITTRAEILALLKLLLLARAPLDISFTGRSQSYQSYVVNVDIKTASLLLDEMIPNIGDKWASQGESFRVDAWMEGAHIRWQSPGARQVLFEDTPAFHIPLPATLTYHQRRDAFRATVQRSIDTHLELIHAKDKPQLEGELLDISATGCKARLAGNQLHLLQSGDRYELSRLLLPEEAAFNIELEIRHCSYHSNTDETHVGLRFQQPTPTVQRQINRFVHYLQREARRLEKEDLF